MTRSGDWNSKAIELTRQTEAAGGNPYREIALRLIHGDCLSEIKKLPDNSVDAVVTDPPYGLSFMGKKWDYDVPSVEVWAECLRVLKPGGYLLAFAGTRTQHRMAVRIEDAGFEIRDMIAWVYGSGFPKSLNVGKAVDKLQGNERESEIVKGKIFTGSNNNINGESGEYEVTKGTSPWEGWGTALKPALEPITVARKPLNEKTVAKNCLEWGTGGINIDECRVEAQIGDKFGGGGLASKNAIFQGESKNPYKKGTGFRDDSAQGRFPANLIHDGSDEVVSLFPNDSQRFFYSPKASKNERNKGCEGLPPAKNNHPTVKPIALMEYLVKLVSREGATVLDPFAGSGTTGIACKNLNRNFIGIELDADYMKIAEKRIESISPTRQKGPSA
jgi:DNA modification methylase